MIIVIPSVFSHIDMFEKMCIKIDECIVEKESSETA